MGWRVTVDMLPLPEDFRGELYARARLWRHTGRMWLTLDEWKLLRGGNPALQSWPNDYPILAGLPVVIDNTRPLPPPVWPLERGRPFWQGPELPPPAVP